MTERSPLPILFVHHRRELGGAPESLAYLIRELDRDRFQAHVVVPEGQSADLFRAAGATVHPGTVAAFTHIWASTYSGLRWLLLARELARLPAHVRDMRRTLREVRPALVHVNDSPALPAAWLARRAGVPVVVHLRSALPEHGGRRRSQLVRRSVARLADASVAINDDVAASFGVGSVVVPNAVDLGRFHPGDARGAPPAVSSFGFIYPSKGFREFIAAAGLVRNGGIEATYRLVGGGVRSGSFFRTPLGRLLVLLGATADYEAEAHGLIARLGLSDAVRVEPYRGDVAEIYRGSDVVVAPSQGPELGRSVVEAAASGVPVVATGSRTGGGIVVPGETGLIAPDRTAEAIAEALRELLSDPQRREALGRAARTHAEERFDPARAARAVEAVYMGLMGS
jgi:glycosyltransferase involved in cell wall biosynthesis